MLMLGSLGEAVACEFDERAHSGGNPADRSTTKQVSEVQVDAEHAMFELAAAAQEGLRNLSILFLAQQPQ